jgi:hypothetical protein
MQATSLLAKTPGRASRCPLSFDVISRTVKLSRIVFGSNKVWICAHDTSSVPSLGERPHPRREHSYENCNNTTALHYHHRTWVKTYSAFPFAYLRPQHSAMACNGFANAVLQHKQSPLPNARCLLMYQPRNPRARPRITIRTSQPRSVTTVSRLQTSI